MISTFNKESEKPFLALYHFDGGRLSVCYTWLLVWFGIFQGIVLLGLFPPLFHLQVRLDIIILYTLKHFIATYFIF